MQLFCCGPSKGSLSPFLLSLSFASPPQTPLQRRIGLPLSFHESRRGPKQSHFDLAPQRKVVVVNMTMKTDGDLAISKTIPDIGPPSSVRPKHIKNFSVPYEDYVIRAWQPRDRLACMDLIKVVLKNYNLEWDPIAADRDVVEVEEAYREGEFWVIENVFTAKLVGTAAFYEVPHRGKEIVEIRKMYLSNVARGRGLGSFLLSALEQRALQLGYKKAVIETASVLKEACDLYLRRGYINSNGLETERCDIVLEKVLNRIGVPEEDHVEVIDRTRGWSVTCVPRKKAFQHRLLGRAVVVLIESAGNILVHKRSMKKSTYPGRISALITGCVDWMENPLEAAKREVFEEVGLRSLEFFEPFAPYVSRGQDRLGQRIQFHPFVARGDFGEGDIVCDHDEVESAWMLTREAINEQKIGGSLWQDFREHGL